jgi:hypothetical protein
LDASGLFLADGFSSPNSPSSLLYAFNGDIDLALLDLDFDLDLD